MDDVTATPADVLQGKTAYMMGGDDPAGGTMPNNGAWTGRIGVNGRAAIPAGYHNGSGYVDQSIPTMDAQTITPGASQQVAPCSGKYMTGNVTVPAVSGLVASSIKKGVIVGGVTGTFEGYVPTATDLYLRGNNIVNFQGDSRTDGISFESGGIYFPLNCFSTKRLWTYNTVNFTGYSKLNVEFVITKLQRDKYAESVDNVNAKFFYKIVPPPLSGNDGALDPDFRASYGGKLSINTVATLSFNIILPSITHFGITMECSYYPNGIDWEGYIYRIWLS